VADERLCFAARQNGMPAIKNIFNQDIFGSGLWSERSFQLVDSDFKWIRL
jgi:hypothetical protein